MVRSVATFLMFEGRAEEAMNLYVSVFPEAKIDHVERYGAGGPGKEGTVMRAGLTFAGQRFMFFDSFVKHAFTFTPAASIFVECAGEAEFDAAFAKLSEGGGIMMPPGNYGFSPKYAWIADRFGVAWQLNWAGPA